MVQQKIMIVHNLGGNVCRQNEKVGKIWIYSSAVQTYYRTSGNCSTLSTYYFRLFNFIPSCRKRKNEKEREAF